MLFLHVNGFENMSKTNTELANVRLNDAISSFQIELQRLHIHITLIGIMQEQQISALSIRFGENLNSTSKTIAQLEQYVAVTVKNITYVQLLHYCKAKAYFPFRRLCFDIIFRCFEACIL